MSITVYNINQITDNNNNSAMNFWEEQILFILLLESDLAVDEKH